MKRVPRISVICGHCGISFDTTQELLSKGRGKFCSASCRSKVVVHAMLAVRGERWKENVRAAMRKFRGRDETSHPRWKGDSVGYYGVHDWLTKHFGQPIGCEECGLDDPERKYHWANLSGLYLRLRSDYKRMCVPCHRKYDYAARRKNKELAVA